MPAPTTTTTTMSPGPWQCTPLTAGPLSMNCYTMNIVGLSANTCYEFRSVFVVSGTCYCANNTQFGKTQAISVSIPTVATGLASSPAPYPSDWVTGNYVIDKCGSCIQEYGTLYTMNPSYNTDSTLIYANVGTDVKKISSFGDVPTGYTLGNYGNLITGLTPSTVVYYRAFAKNSVGPGNGTIKSVITQAPPNDYVDVCIVWDAPWLPSQCGFAGAYRLRCCDGTLLESCVLSPYKLNSLSNWSVPAGGCYYVDFTGLQAYCGSAGISWDIMWCDNTHVGESSMWTCCFTGNNFVCAELPAPTY